MAAVVGADGGMLPDRTAMTPCRTRRVGSWQSWRTRPDCSAEESPIVRRVVLVVVAVVGGTRLPRRRLGGASLDRRSPSFGAANPDVGKAF
jgi:hypothetical protein